MTVPDSSTAFPLEDGPLSAGMRVGSYLVERHLGSGGMGAVYAATHVGLDKPVALKALHRTFASREKSVKRFVREGRAASRIRHPHVVDVTDVGSHDGIPFLVMEMLDGEDLEQHLERHGSLEASRLAEIMLPVIDAVATAHDAGVIHRDLKPSNIFLAQDGRGNEVPKVLDFGIARMLHEPGADRIRLTQQGSFVGTPYYASPEQATNGSAADARSDQYSIGAILYQLASGELPVKGDNPFEVLTAIVCGEITPFSTLDDMWHPALVEVVERAMSFEAEDRYPDLRALGRGLLNVADDETHARYRAAFSAPARSIAFDATAPAMAQAGPPAATPKVAAVEFAARAVQPQMRAVLPDGRIPAASIEAPMPQTRTALPRVNEPRAEPAQFTTPVAQPTESWSMGAKLVWLVVGLLIVGSAAATGVWIARPAPPPPIIPPPTAHAPDVVLRVTPPHAAIELDGEPVGTGEARLPSDGVSHRLRISADGFETLDRTLAAGVSPPTSIQLIATPEPVELPAAETTEAEVPEAEVPEAEATEAEATEAERTPNEASERTASPPRAPEPHGRRRDPRPAAHAGRRSPGSFSRPASAMGSGTRFGGSSPRTTPRPAPPRPAPPRAPRPSGPRVGANNSPVLP